MLTPQELLHEGEKLLGSYNIEIARWANARWVSTVPPLFAVLTDHRMILQPHARKRHEPAVIPAGYITTVEDMQAEHRHGLVIHLRTGHQIGMFISLHFHDFSKNLHSMLIPPSPIRFESDLELGSLQKIINFIEKL